MMINWGSVSRMRKVILFFSEFQVIIHPVCIQQAFITTKDWNSIIVETRLHEKCVILATLILDGNYLSILNTY